MARRHFIAVAALALCAVDAHAAAARVDFVYGEVRLAGPDGSERPLGRGVELNNGDIVRTAQGRAQLRFADGAYVSLQPNSEFAIRDYRFDGKTDGQERGFFALAKGAMRTVTGLIGRLHRDRYQIITPTATIGIRGTGGVIQVLEDGSTLVVGTSGIWSLTNPAGTVDVPAGVSALAPAKGETAPQRTSQAPQAGPAPLVPAAFAQGEERTASGAPAGFGETVRSFTPLTSGSGYGAATSFIGERLPQGFLITDTGATASFNSVGQLTELTYSDGQSFKLDPVLGAHADFGSDGVLAWGRWTGKVTGQFICSPGTVCPLDKQYSSSEGLHYVIGTPTPVLPSSGSATYTLLGASKPTYVNGSTAPGTFSGSLNVTFGAQASIGGQFSAAMPDKTYAWTATGTTASSIFSLTSTPTSGCAASTCGITTQGFFAGPSAERAGVTYKIQESNVPAVIGTAAFAKQ